MEVAWGNDGGAGSIAAVDAATTAETDAAVGARPPCPRRDCDCDGGGGGTGPPRAGSGTAAVLRSSSPVAAPSRWCKIARGDGGGESVMVARGGGGASAAMNGRPGCASAGAARAAGSGCWSTPDSAAASAEVARGGGGDRLRRRAGTTTWGGLSAAPGGGGARLPDVGAAARSPAGGAPVSRGGASGSWWAPARAAAGGVRSGCCASRDTLATNAATSNWGAVCRAANCERGARGRGDGRQSSDAARVSSGWLCSCSPQPPPVEHPAGTRARAASSRPPPVCTRQRARA